jgi:hypothetical protein
MFPSVSPAPRSHASCDDTSLSGVMLAGPARLAAGSMQACHEAISDGEGLVQQWRVTQLTRLGIPGPPAQAEADRVDWHQIAGLVQRSALRGWCGGWPSMSSVSPDVLGRSWCMAAVSTSASGAWAMSAGVVP